MIRTIARILVGALLIALDLVALYLLVLLLLSVPDGPWDERSNADQVRLLAGADAVLALIRLALTFGAVKLRLLASRWWYALPALIALTAAGRWLLPG